MSRLDLYGCSLVVIGFLTLPFGPERDGSVLCLIGAALLILDATIERIKS